MAGRLLKDYYRLTTLGAGGRDIALHDKRSKNSRNAPPGVSVQLCYRDRRRLCAGRAKWRNHSIDFGQKKRARMDARMAASRLSTLAHDERADVGQCSLRPNRLSNNPILFRPEEP